MAGPGELMAEPEHEPRALQPPGCRETWSKEYLAGVFSISQLIPESHGLEHPHLITSLWLIPGKPELPCKATLLKSFKNALVYFSEIVAQSDS